MIRRVAILLSPIFLLLPLAGCQPANTRETGFLVYEPLPGYAWVDPDALIKETRWQPGSGRSDFPNVVAASTEGRWHPRLGYDWVTGDATDLAVQWKAGLRYDSLPNMSSSAEEGKWAADPGYSFEDPALLAVSWKAGMAHPHRKHYFSSATEGNWDIEPGYAEQSTLLGSYAAWSPGAGHPQFPNIYAAASEGYWHAAAGYRFVAADSLQVELAPAAYVEAGPSAGERFIGGLVKLVVGAYFSESQPDDGAFAGNVGRPVARFIARDGLQDMADSIQ